MLRDEFDRFCALRAKWLDQYACFMALTDVHGTSEWTQWAAESASVQAILAQRDHGPSRVPKELDELTSFHRFVQFMFFRQWQAIRDCAHGLGIWILGDMPIYVSHASSDVWANRELFDLDVHGLPRRLAGVPPDYFSSTGQLWHNPLYNWAAMKHHGYAWWIQRMQTILDQVDLVRLDHFRGLEAYWAVPVHEETAERGEWLSGPGADLLEALRQAWLRMKRLAPWSIPRCPSSLKTSASSRPQWFSCGAQFGLPGMSVLQFAFAQHPRRAIPAREHPGGDGGLYGHTRQRHDGRMVPIRDSARSAGVPSAASLRSWHATGHRLGDDPRGLANPRIPVHRAAPGRTVSGQRVPLEHSRY